MSKLTKDRLIISLLIVLVSFIYGLPHIIMTLRIGENYDPIALTSTSSIPKDKGYAYAPYVNKVISDGFFLKEAYVYEYLNFPTPYVGETIPSNILAILVRLTGSITNAFVAADFIMPSLTFLLIYLVARLFIKNTIFAASIAFLATVSRDLILVIPYPKATIEYLSAQVNQQQFLHFNRAFHPQITFPIFALGILSTLKFISKPTFIRALLMGAVQGILFYTYLFFWTYFLFFLSIIALVFILKKEYKISALVCVAILISFIIGSYYFYNIYQFYTSAISEDFTQKMTGPSVAFNPIVFRFILIPAALAYFLKPNDNKKIAFIRRKTVFIVFLLTSVLIIFTSKIVLGRDLETLHYIRRAVIPFATTAVFMVVYFLFQKKQLLILTISIAIFLIGAASAVKIQYSATQYLSTELVINNDRENLFNWLRLTTAKNSVIGTLDTSLNLLIPAKTNNLVYFPPTLRTITPTTEELERYIVLNNMMGINAIQQKSNLDDFLGYMYHARVYAASKESDKIRSSVEQEIDYKSSGAWKEGLKNNKLDYLIIPSNDLKNVKPDTEFLEPVTSVGPYIIFKVKI